MINFSVLLPTKERPSLLLRLLESIEDTAHDPSSIEIILYTDEDDASSRSAEVSGLDMVKLTGPPGTPMGRIFNECYAASRGRHLMLLNDDAVVRTRDWDLRVLEAFSRFPDGIALVYGNDLDQGKRVPTFPILSRRTCELMGEVCPSGYLNLHIESHIKDVFRQLKRMGHDRVVYLDDVVFEHMHFTTGKSDPDKTSTKKDPAADDRLFISLDTERRITAGKLAEYIERRNDTAAGKTWKQPVASVIIPLIAGTRNVFRCLSAVTDAPGVRTPFEVIVAGPGIADAFKSFASPPEVNMKFVTLEGKPGFARLSNRAAREAAGDFLVFLNAESLPRPRWLDSMVKEARKADDIAIVGCKHINARNGRVHHAGIGFYAENGGMRVTYLYRGVRDESPAVNRLREFQAVSGDCMLVRKREFMDAGGFDEGLNCLEDVDLCLRMRARGLRVAYTPKAVVHLTGHGSTLSPASDFNGAADDDLDSILAEDGFARRREGGSYCLRRI